MFPLLSCMTRRARMLPVLLMILMLGLFATPAHGQGTSGTLPDPISSDDLDAYAGRLSLSAEQRLGMDGFHERYLSEFRHLRENEIDRYLDDQNAGGRGFRMMGADPEELKKSVEALNRLLGRIKSLDERFFDQVQTILSDEQSPHMLQVRQSRQRARYRTGVVQFIGFTNPGARVDLTTIMQKVELTSDERPNIEPMLAQYEGQLTAMARKLFDATQQMFVDVTEGMAELRAAAEASEDRNQRRRMFESFGDIWTEASKEPMNQASQISGLNLRTYRAVRPLISGSAAQQLDVGFLSQAYPEVFHGPRGVLAKFDIALRLSALTDGQRSAIEQARSSFDVRQRTLGTQMIDTQEVIRRESMTMMRFGSQEKTSEEERFEELQQRQQELNERALDELYALLGPDLVEELRSPTDGDGGDDDTISVATGVVVMGGGGGPGGAIHSITIDGGSLSLNGELPDGLDPFLPGPISQAELDSYAALLELDDDQADLLATLHTDYLDRYEHAREEHIDPLLEAQENLWAFDEDSGEITAPEAGDIDGIFGLRAMALQAILANDESLFTEIELVLGEPGDDDMAQHMQRIRRGRQRIVYNRRGIGTGGGNFAFGGGRGGGRARSVMINMGSSSNRESSIDLVQMVQSMSLSADSTDQLAPALDDYERRFVEALVYHYETAVRNELVNEKFRATMMGRGRGGDRGGRGGRGMRGGLNDEQRGQMETTREALQEAATALRELNQTTRDTLAGHLTNGTGEALRRAYRREAYPDVYVDPDDAEPSLLKALALTDVTEGQRGALRELLAEYREPYDDWCEQMVTLREDEAGQEDGGGWNPERFQRLQERNNDLEQLRFHRTELCKKTLGRLTAILTEEQAQEIGLAVTR